MGHYQSIYHALYQLDHNVPPRHQSLFPFTTLAGCSGAIARISRPGKRMGKRQEVTPEGQNVSKRTFRTQLWSHRQRDEGSFSGERNRRGMTFARW